MTQQTSDIFDLIVQSDLPESLKSRLKVNRVSELERKIRALFAEKRRLNLDELTVGLFRKFDYQTTRLILNTKVYNMTTAGILNSIDGIKGCWEISQ